MTVPRLFSLASRRRGFTLAETLISATIASTALVTALTLLSQGVSDTQQSHQQASAMLLARRVTTEIQGQIFRADAQNTNANAATAPVDTTLHVEVYDSALHPLDTSGQSAETLYASGAKQFKAVYLVSWQLTPTNTQATTPQAISAKITVETPAGGTNVLNPANPADPKIRRHSFNYATLLSP